MEFLLNKESLKGLSQEDQAAVKDQALGQFLLGSIFGGQGIASGYQAVQNIIPNIQKQKQQQGLLSELTGIQQEFFPTQAQAGQRALAAEGKGPTITAAENQQAILQKPIDTGAALTRIGRLATNPNATQMLPGLTKVIEGLQPKLQEGLFIGPSGNIIGAAPKVDVKTGTVTRGTMQDGQLQFQTDVLGGAKQAAAYNTLPELEKGQEYVFDANKNVVGVKDTAGAIQSMAAREAATISAREANIPREITTSTGAKGFTFVRPPGLSAQGGATQGTTGQGGGMNVGGGQGAPMQGGGGGGSLTTAQAALNASYEPILKDAYAGYKVASQRSGTLQQLQNALNNPNFDTNAFTPAKTAIASFLNASGVSGDVNKQYLTSSASARQAVNTIAAQTVTELPGAISNFEIGYAQNRFATLTDPKESNRYAIALMQEADQRKKEFYNFVSNPKNAGPDVVQKWENSPQGKKSLFEAPALRQYLPTKLIDKGPDKGKKAYILPNGDAVLFN
jgi:hypothetical protein